MLGMRCSTMIRTRSGLPKHCSWAIDRHGKRRVRFRTPDVSVYLTGVPWSEDFMKQYAAAIERTSAGKRIGSKPFSVDALATDYRDFVFQNLAVSTRIMRDGVLIRFCREHGDKPVDDL